jgi:hypothetical protein
MFLVLIRLLDLTMSLSESKIIEVLGLLPLQLKSGPIGLHTTPATFTFLLFFLFYIIFLIKKIVWIFSQT